MLLFDVDFCISVCNDDINSQHLFIQSQQWKQQNDV